MVLIEVNTWKVIWDRIDKIHISVKFFSREFN